VQPQQLTDGQDGDADHRQQNDQDCAGERGELLVSIRASAEQRSYALLARSRPAAAGGLHRRVFKELHAGDDFIHEQTDLQRRMRELLQP
jgi:hypothetical protein